jgi:hypothetical protein
MKVRVESALATHNVFYLFDLVRIQLPIKGSGWAFYLTEDGDDDSRCLLLDHVPADPAAAANPMLEETWDHQYVTVDIPDVSCAKCSILLQNVMVDKSGAIGAPDGPGCTYNGAIGTCTQITNGPGYSYHSCSVPLKITGTIPRSQYTCPGQPSDWPTVWEGDGGARVDTGVANLYRRASGMYANGFPLSGMDEEVHHCHSLKQNPSLPTPFSIRCTQHH